MEKEMGIIGSQEVKVIIATVLNDLKNVIRTHRDCGATSYIVKPISRNNLIAE